MYFLAFRIFFFFFNVNWPIWRETQLNRVSFFAAFLEFNNNSPDRWMETERGGEYILKGRHKKAMSTCEGKGEH